MFRLIPEKGLQMTFANDLTISIAFGRENYCDNHFLPIAKDADLLSKNAEIGIWKGNKAEMVIRSYRSPDEVAALIARVAAFAPDISYWDGENKLRR